MRRLRHALAVSLLLLLALTASGCGRDRSLCEYANGLVTDARLTEAANAYAAAQRSGEGRCADTGADKVADLRRDVTKHVAAGRAALAAGDKAKARSAYEAALAVDRGDETARGELLLLGQATPAPPVPTLVVQEVPAKRDRPSVFTWLALATAVTTAIVNAALLVLWHRRVAAIGRQVGASLRTVYGMDQRISDVERRAAATDRRVDEAGARIDRTGATVAALDRTVTESALTARQLSAMDARLSEVDGRVASANARAVAANTRMDGLAADAAALRDDVERSQRTLLRLIRSTATRDGRAVAHERFVRPEDT
ncbi:hypothetical protein O7634_29865 [Micromonospora sp. WMMD1120]|uniref:hypothetical protein n=1 Tax=Micromonospora sp. WMMD1120 TaxID=3016106 RepID=UPI0024178470|nr:hypothetical protein [Micromonospora sp. WMMD1120]MDG4810986.1 hypothetical protein [Micromonospora sp. WMMD1120]